MRRDLDELMAELKAKRELVHKERDWFQRPKLAERPDHSGGWDANPDYSGASWSGERFGGRGWGGGRDR